MGLSEAIAETSEDAFGDPTLRRCRVYQLLCVLGDRDRESVQQLLANKDKLSTKLVPFFREQAVAARNEAKSLKGDDKKQKLSEADALGAIALAGLQRHRRGICSCGGTS